MSTMAISPGYVTPISQPQARPAIGRAGERTCCWSWRALADTASGLTFLGVLGWESWRIGGYLLQLVPQMVGAGGGYLF